MTATSQSQPGRRALLLSSDAAQRAGLERALAGRGLEVRSCPDGESGLAALLDDLLSLDVLVLDLRLDGRDAWSFLRLVRLAGGERELPNAVAASAPDARTRARLVAAGADAVIDASGVEGAGAVERLARRGRPARRARPWSGGGNALALAG